MRTAQTLLHAFLAFAVVFSSMATALMSFAPVANAQSIGYPTSIGFQGRLKDSDGQAVTSGTYDFRFRFFDSSDATATSSYIYVNDISVTNGFFSAPIPLGADIVDFVNELELEVGTVASSGAGASSSGDYETFSSRITMYKAPYAVFTQGIENSASDPSNAYAGRIYYNTSNNELKVYDGSAWDTMADTLDKAYDNFGSAAQIVTVDDAVTGLEFSVEAAGNMTFDLQSTGDLVVQDAGTAWATFTDSQDVDIDGTGSISLDADAASNFNTSSGDLTFDAEAGSVNIDGGEAAADAVRVNASSATGGIDIDAGSGGITIDSTGAIALGGAAASTFSTTSGDLTLLADANSVIVKGDEAVADAILLDADTSEGSGIYLDAYDATNNTSGTVAVDARMLDINLTGSSTSHGMDVDVSGSGAPISFSTTDGDVVLTAGGSTGDINLTSEQSDIAIETSTASKTINIGSTNFARTVNISTGNGNDTVNIGNNAVGTKVIRVGNNTSSSSLDLNAGTGAIDIDTNGGEIQIDGGLTDIGSGTYTVANGSGDLGVAGDLEINGSTNIVDLTVESGARIGTGSTPDAFTALDDDSLFVEGQLEVDGNARFDAIFDLNGSLDADVTDFDANSSGGIQLTAAATTADAIDIHSAGTVTGTALNLETTDGGIEIDANGAINGDITLAATDNFTAQVETNSALVNLFDYAVSKTIDIGGVDADGTDTINIATENTSPDIISIGNSHSGTTVALTSGNWNMAASGVLTLAPTSAQTTGLILTDTDFTNALSVGDNNIIGTTGNIDFTNFDLTGADGSVSLAGGDFDVDASGNITDVSNITSDGDLTITGGDITGSNGDRLKIGSASDSEFTLDLNSDSTATLTASDSVDANTPLTIMSAGTGTLTLDAGGAGSVAVGSADVTGITFTTDNNATDDISFTGGATFNDDVAFAMGAGEEFVFTKASTAGDTTVDERGMQLNFTAGAGAGGDRYEALEINVTNATHLNGTDNVRALSIGDLALGGSNGTEIALDIGTGWDADIAFDSTTAQVALEGSGGSSLTFMEAQSGSALLTITENSNEGDVAITGDLVADAFTGTVNSNLTVSAGSASSSAGGDLTLNATAGNGDTSVGGAVLINTGDGVTHSSTGAGSNAGSFTITTGDGGNASGGGSDNGGNGGDIFLRPGVGGTATGGGLTGLDGYVKLTAPGDSSGTFTERLCTDSAGGDGVALTNNRLGDCDSTGQADYAEMYPAAEEVTYGHVVVPGEQVVTTNDASHGEQQITQVVLSSESYQTPVVGIVSNNYGDGTSAGYNIQKEDNPMPVALVGRVPVKVVAEGGPIRTGDFVATSSTPGYAMRATEAGRVVGMALADWDGESETVMVQVMNTWYTPPASEASSLQGGSATQVTVADTVNASMTTFSGSVTVADHLYGSRDMAGRARLNAGDKTVRVTFEQEYLHLPIVTFSVRTSELVPGRLWISDEDTTGFTINHSAGSTTPYDIEFNWIAVGVEEAIVSISNGEIEEVQVTIDSNVIEESVEQTSEETDPSTEEEDTLQNELEEEEVSGELPSDDSVAEEDTQTVPEENTETSDVESSEDVEVETLEIVEEGETSVDENELEENTSDVQEVSDDGIAEEDSVVQVEEFDEEPQVQEDQTLETIIDSE